MDLPPSKGMCRRAPSRLAPYLAATPFTEWLWGGMQYQLEHHLFPTMPRYRYRALAPRVAAWCAAHAHVGAEYRSLRHVEWAALVAPQLTVLAAWG